MTKADLEAQIAELNRQITALHEQQTKLQGQLSDIIEEEDLDRKMGRLNDRELQRLAQRVNALGVGSGEAVGTPGA